MLFEGIKKLVQYGIDTGLIPRSEKIYTTNQLLSLFQEENYEDVPCDLVHLELEEILTCLLDEAVSRGIIEDTSTYRDLFDAKLMNCLLPRPAQIQQEFQTRYQQSPLAATEYYYKLSQDSDYIRRYRIKKDQKWKVNTEYGSLDITINLSKPEKTQRQSQQPARQSPPPTPNVCSVWKTRDTLEELTILPGTITESYR